MAGHLVYPQTRQRMLKLLKVAIRLYDGTLDAQRNRAFRK
jgi:hypothetical protein